MLNQSSHTDELEPIGATVLLEEELLAVGEAARLAALAFGRVGAVEVGDVLVADVAEPGGKMLERGLRVNRGRDWGFFLFVYLYMKTEWNGEKEDEPMDFTCVLEQSQRDRMHWSISPPLVKEPPGPIQVLEVILVCLAPPKFHVGNLEIAPEMAGRVAVRLGVMLRSPTAVLQPLPRIVLVLVFRVRGQELERLGPEGGNALRGVVQVNGEAVRLVAVGHVAEHVVVNVTEKVDLGLHAPVVARVGEGRVAVEQA